jgi:predicted O-methyltransferase YrrM
MDIKKLLFGAIDLAYLPVSLILASIAYIQTRLGPKRLQRSYRVWDGFSVTPVRHHYYQPVFNVHTLPDRLWNTKDPLHGINFNEDAQLALLEQFNYQDELRAIPIDSPSDYLGFYYRNNSFEAGDAEMLYNMVRKFKPKRVIEIGSGYSTRIMKQAMDANRAEGIFSTLLCIEPYEMPWLEQLGVDMVIRQKVEDIDRSQFDELEANDILFIDSSHVLRIGGDVIVEYLHILPAIKSGVIIHIHDIFLPYEYPKDWIVNERRFWTEQYILQAFLAFNHEYEILSAVHWLSREHSTRLSAACPVYGHIGGTPGSFWMRRL